MNISFIVFVNNVFTLYLPFKEGVTLLCFITMSQYFIKHFGSKQIYLFIDNMNTSIYTSHVTFPITPYTMRHWTIYDT